MKRARKKTLMTCLIVAFLLFCFGLESSVTFAQEAKSEETETRLEKKAKEAEALKDKKEAAEKAKREEAELERQKAAERAKAKAEAEKLTKLDEEAKSLAKEKIAKAKSKMKAELAELDAKAKRQKAEISAQKAQLKRDYEEDKAKLLAQKKDKAIDENQYKGKLLQLKSDYKNNVASLKQKQREQKAQTSQDKTLVESKYKEEVAKIEFEKKSKMAQARVQKLKLPEDRTARLSVKEIKIRGNILVPDSEIIEKLPIIYNASDEPPEKADPEDLYDFTTIGKIILEPGVSREVSARTIQGFTQYILSLYQEHKYAGIYVYVPREVLIKGKELKDGILQVEVLEAPVAEVTVKSYDPDQNEKEKGYLRQSAVHEWSPVKPGQVASQKELDDYVNLLNLNPDRYVSAVVTRGAKPNTLAVAYDVYESSPWHWFIQLDNAGTKDREWTPRVGLINTNLLGIDDTFIAIYQAPWEKGIEEEYSIYGSYDLPVMGPKLRFNLYGGYSEFDVNPDATNINFIGSGNFLGGRLTYNILQTDADCVIGDGWFFDIRLMAERTRSKVKPSIFPQFLKSDVRFWVWGWGLHLHRSDDISSSSVSFDQQRSWHEESGDDAFNAARTGANDDFSIYNFSASHSQFLDKDKINRLSGNFQWIGTNERLVPAKMTTFGGMYTVRGYDEYEIVADGGMLASVQYEYDLVALDESKDKQKKSKELQEKEKKNPLRLKKLAPLAFLDYGRTTIKHANASVNEKKHEELMSIGIGAITDIGDHFNGAVYYGYPLIATPDTRTGKGRVNVSFMLRW